MTAKSSNNSNNQLTFQRLWIALFPSGHDGDRILKRLFFNCH